MKILPRSQIGLGYDRAMGPGLPQAKQFFVVSWEIAGIVYTAPLLDRNVEENTKESKNVACTSSGKRPIGVQAWQHRAVLACGGSADAGPRHEFVFVYITKLTVIKGGGRHSCIDSNNRQQKPVMVAAALS